MKLSSKWVQLAALAVLVAVLPLFFPSGYYYRVGALIFVNGLAVTGLVILIGYAGQISLGHAGFAGIGGYACALAPEHLGLPPSLSILLGAAISALLAFSQTGNVWMAMGCFGTYMVCTSIEGQIITPALI